MIESNQANFGMHSRNSSSNFPSSRSGNLTIFQNYLEYRSCNVENRQFEIYFGRLQYLEQHKFGIEGAPNDRQETVTVVKTLRSIILYKRACIRQTRDNLCRCPNPERAASRGARGKLKGFSFRTEAAPRHPKFCSTQLDNI